jgi:hypothetical protein
MLSGLLSFLVQPSSKEAVLPPSLATLARTIINWITDDSKINK